MQSRGIRGVERPGPLSPTQPSRAAQEEGDSMAVDKNNVELTQGDIVIVQARVEDIRENEGIVLLQLLEGPQRIRVAPAATERFETMIEAVTRDWEQRLERAVAAARDLDERQRKEIADLTEKLALVSPAKVPLALEDLPKPEPSAAQ